MNLEAYQGFVHTIMSQSSKESVKDELLTATLGLNGEAGEFADHIKKWLYHGHKLDNRYCLLELGDILWYLTAGASAIGVSLQDVIDANVHKLLTRYQGGQFTTEESINRVEGAPEAVHLAEQELS